MSPVPAVWCDVAIIAGSNLIPLPLGRGLGEGDAQLKKLQRTLVALLLCGFIFAAVTTHSAEQHVQQLVSGTSGTINTDYDIGDAAITNPAVCDYVVRDSHREIYLNARGSGTAMLTVWDAKGEKRDVIPIVVSAVDAQAVQTQAQSALGLGHEIRFVSRGDHIVMEGEVDSPETLEKVEAYVARDPHLQSRVRVGAKALGNLAQQVERAINRPGIVVRLVKDRLVLEGVAYSADAAHHAEQIAQIYNSNVLNQIEVRESNRTPGARPLVYLDVYFMEIKKGTLQSFGVHWNPGAARQSRGGAGGGGLGIGDLLGSTVGFVFDLLPKLRWIHERGAGRVLEHPTLLVKSGESGELFSGVEVPYPSAQQVQFKNIGITIKAEPIASGQDVDLKLAVEVSAPSAGVDGAIDRRNISTSAFCHSGESLVLGGLWGNGRVAGFNRAPAGGDINSSLFNINLSKDSQSRQSDFVVFVTPRIATRPDPANAVVEQWNASEHDARRDKKITRCETRDHEAHIMSPRGLLAEPVAEKNVAAKKSETPDEIIQLPASWK